MKRPERSRRSRRLTPVEALEARALLTMTATAPLPNLSVATGAAVAPTNLDSYFKDPNASTDFAIFDTTLGTIPVQLTPATTPLTVANFLNYANKGDYTNTIVHRSVPGFIWQAGGFQLATGSKIAAIPSDAPVHNEFGASNVRGTIAMAKLGNDPNSATNQFFFNESDANAANLDNQNGGFTVFGHVVGAAGLAVMDAVAAVPTPTPSPLSSPLDQIPLQNYNAGAGVQPSNLIVIKSVTPASELFLASSDAPGVAIASVQGNSLTVTPLGPGTAHITVVGYGSDGKTATETFAVDVASASQPAPTTPTPSTPPVDPTSQPASVPPPISPLSQPATLPPATPSSVLMPSARGPLPASVVAGQKARIQQVVSLMDSSKAVAQTERVALSLSTTTTGSPGDFTIAAALKRVNLKVGRQARVTLSARQVAASVPVGTYHVLVSVTDPDGAKSTVDTGRTMVVQAPKVKPLRKS